MNKFLKNPPKPPFPKKISCEYSTIQTHSFRIVTRLCHYSEDRIPVIFLGRLHSRNSQRPYCPMPLKHASVSPWHLLLPFGMFGNALVSLGMLWYLWVYFRSSGTPAISGNFLVCLGIYWDFSLSWFALLYLFST